MPLRSSSRMRALMMTLASTAMPTVSTMPAMPGSVSVADSSDIAATSSTTLLIRATTANTPNMR
jgi:hypothetical protein